MPLPPTFDARLVAARSLAPSVRELTFERADGAPFAFQAGQWVNLLLPLPEGEIKRAYSVASAPDGSPRFQLAVTHVEGGPGSTFLHAMIPGASLRVVGPQGFFTRPLDHTGPSLFVATGTGITPLRSMLHAALAAQNPLPITLLFGVRRPEDILYRDELEALVASHAHFRFVPTLSRADDGWAGRRGYVQLHARELVEDLAQRGPGAPHIYVCGLHRMVGTVRDLLRKDMGLPREVVHTERYD